MYYHRLSLRLRIKSKRATPEDIVKRLLDLLLINKSAACSQDKDILWNSPGAKLAGVLVDDWGEGGYYHLFSVVCHYLVAWVSDSEKQDKRLLRIALWH